VTMSVIENITKKTNCSPTDMDGMDNEDLILMAKALHQKGNITESLKLSTGAECLVPYTEVTATAVGSYEMFIHFCSQCMYVVCILHYACVVHYHGLDADYL